MARRKGFRLRRWKKLERDGSRRVRWHRSAIASRLQRKTLWRFFTACRSLSIRRKLPVDFAETILFAGGLGTRRSGQTLARASECNGTIDELDRLQRKALRKHGQLHEFFA